MRILIESPNCNAFAGSNGAVGYGWITQLARAHEIHLVVYGPAYDEGHPGGVAPPVSNVHPIRVGPSRAGRLGRNTDFVVSARRRRRILDRVRPDVVHSIEPGSWGGPRVFATRRVPYVMGPLVGGAVIAPRSFLDEVLEGLPVTPARALLTGGIKKLAVRMVNEALFGDLPTTQMLGRAAMRKAVRVVVATSLTPGAIPAGIADRVRRIPLVGIDLDRFRPAGRSHEGSAPTVLYAGRIVATKGLHLLIEAIARTSASLRIAGPAGEQWYEAHCRARVEALGIDDRVVWLGTLPRDDLTGEYGRADVYCMLSLWEPYGLTYVESLACGTPVIGLAAGGVPEIVPAGAGWLMKPTTVEDVIEQTAACLNRLAADRTEIEAAGTCAREAAEQTWSWDRLREQMLNLYREIV